MFSAALEIVLTIAYREAVSRRHAYLTLEHLLYALAHDNDGERILQACGADLPRLRKELNLYLDTSVEQVKRGHEREPEQTAAFQRVLQTAVLHVQSAQRQEVHAGDILAAILQQPKSQAARLLESHGITPARRARLHLARRLEGAAPNGAASEGSEAPAGTGTEGSATTRDPLSSYCVNLTDRARRGQLDPLIGRTAELQRTIEVLCRRRKNNPVFVGEAGVGKTAMAEGLALRLISDDVPAPAQGGRDLLARHRRAPRRHALPRRLRGALQGRHPRARGQAPRDSLHRRDPLDRRRGCDDGRHDGSRDAHQADSHGRRPSRHRIDDVRGVQARREGPRAGAAAPEDRDRRAVDRGDGQDSRRSARTLRSAPRRDLHGRRARVGGQARGASSSRLQTAGQRDRRDRRSWRRDENSSRGPERCPTHTGRFRAAHHGGRGGHRGHRRAHGPHPRAPGILIRSRASAHARGVARAGGLRSERGGPPRRAVDQAVARGPRPARPAGGMLSLHRSDRCRQDRARQAAGAAPRQRVHPLRHERVHGEARGRAPHRRASRLRGLRAGRTARRRRPLAPVQRRAPRRNREGAPGHLQHPAAGHGPRDA